MQPRPDRPARRLGAFAVALAVTFGAAFGVGRLSADEIDPLTPATDHDSGGPHVDHRNGHQGAPPSDAGAGR
jgi:hypothetical protein